MILTPQHPLCEVSVCIPVRNEEHYIAACLDALLEQYDFDGSRIDPRRYEILLLINNNSDATAEIVRRRMRRQTIRTIFAQQLRLPALHANVGTARRFILNEGQRRFAMARRPGLLATTDADTVVDRHWLAATIASIRRGADCVSGYIAIDPAELATLPDRTQMTIAADRYYRTLLHRYSQHFLTLSSGRVAAGAASTHYHQTGASLALTTAAYGRCGGVPRVATHEDVGLVRALRRIDARIDQTSAVRVCTSARYSARAKLGMGETLALWNAQGHGPSSLTVTAPEFELRQLRRRDAFFRYWIACQQQRSPGRLADFISPQSSGPHWREAFDASRPFGEFWQTYTEHPRFATLKAAEPTKSLAEAIAWLAARSGKLPQFLAADSRHDGVGCGLP